MNPHRVQGPPPHRAPTGFLFHISGPTAIAPTKREPDPYADVPLLVKGQPETRKERATRLQREAEMRTPQQWMNFIVDRRAEAQAAAKLAAEQERIREEQAELERLNDPYYRELNLVADLELGEDVWQEVDAWREAVDEEKARRRALRLKNKRAIDGLKPDAKSKHRKRDREHWKRKRANENRENEGE